MLVLEFKVKAKPTQYSAINNAIRTGQFIRNKCLDFWRQSKKEDKVNYAKLCSYTKSLSDNLEEFPFVSKLNSMARQAHAERTWLAITRFYDNCKTGIKGKKGYPRFKKNSCSVEYKTSGWNLSKDSRYLTITDKTGIGKLKLVGTKFIGCSDLVKRVRLLKKADGYYAQLIYDISNTVVFLSTGKPIGIDVGLNSFYTDSNGYSVDNPRFLRKAEKKLKKLQRRLSSRKKGSNRRNKQRIKVARQHLKVSRQRKDFAIKTARALVQSNDLIVFEDLKIKNMVKNRRFAKSISDAGWSLFIDWVEYFAKSSRNKYVFSIAPHYTSQNCSNCGNKVQKSLSVRTHDCSQCGYIADRDHNAAKNILQKFYETKTKVGHT